MNAELRTPQIVFIILVCAAFVNGMQVLFSAVQLFQEGKYFRLEI